MDMHFIWIYCHILLFVFWLGGDVGVYMTMVFIRDSKLSYETRATLIKMAFYIDLFPRLSFALILPVGMQLMHSLGLYNFSPALLTLGWGIGIGWSALHLGVVLRKGTRLAAQLLKINKLFEAVMGLVIVLIGITSLITSAPIDQQWLSFKLTLFGLLYWIVLGIDTKFQPFTTLLQMGPDGSTPEKEAEIRRMTNMTMAWAMLMYSLIAIIGFMGTTKPF